MKKLLFVLALGAFAACGSGETPAVVVDSPAVVAPIVDTVAAVVAPIVDTTAAAVDTTKH